MERRYYQCTLLSDIVLNNTSATEGVTKSLNYIPGSNFLGIVARNYDKYSKEMAYHLFHSGKVHFGDAHLVIDKKRSCKKPLSWFQPKIKKDKCPIYLHHELSPDNFKEFSKKGIQLKQIRDGYFVNKNNIITDQSLNHTFSLKSAYDINTRKSKDQEMYGYDALNAGTNWIFYIDAEPEDFKEIDFQLLGERSVGRSKSSQYGRVKIEVLKDYSEIHRSNQNYLNKGQMIMIYFDSNASFMDENYQFTLQPDVKDLMLPDTCQIDWSKSQIGTFVYAPYNAKRKNRDYDRICINKGSVLAITNLPDGFDLADYSQKVKAGLGLFKNEGFGNVLINPDFLCQVKDDFYLNFEINRQNENSAFIQKMKNNGHDDILILECIKGLKNQADSEMSIYKEALKFANDFERKYREITASQWGQIRNLALQAKNNSDLMNRLFEKDKGFLDHGKSLKHWEKLKEHFKTELSHVNENKLIPFLINVCSEMAKRKQGGSK
ncbi:MAG TPA: hypothetical protein PK816_02715 [Candidatus Cloacimonadota bacterium]|nr:hypothetical protein [Candidatus Cloacimonadota bacterium]